MKNKFRGVMQSPVTPLKDDYSLDLPTFEKVLDFHVRTGAPAISWPHHKGESLNLTIAERKLFAETAVKVVNGRVPVSVHVSALAVEDTMALARHAQKIGADGIIAITPYFWTPTHEAIHDYFVRLGTSIDLPVHAYNSPSYLAGVEITGDLMARLIERLPNFIGDERSQLQQREIFGDFARRRSRCGQTSHWSRAWNSCCRRCRSAVSARYSSAGAICPNLCTQLFDACIGGQWPRARELQMKISRLWHLFRDQYPSSLKGGMVIMGRPVGPTRPPLPTATKERQAYIRSQLEELGVLDTEPHGW